MFLIDVPILFANLASFNSADCSWTESAQIPDSWTENDGGVATNWVEKAG